MAMFDKVTTHPVEDFDKFAKKAIDEAHDKVHDMIMDDANPNGCYHAEAEVHNLNPPEEMIGKAWYDYRVNEIEFGVTFYNDDGKGYHCDEDHSVAFISFKGNDPVPV